MAQPPKLDTRHYDDLVAQIEAVAQQVSPWQPRSDGQPDAGRALIRIFGRMVALVSDRLNQVPEKNFLAFLDLIGTQIHPPQPAKVPLTFYLANGRTQDAFVPALTQVAAPATEDDAEDVIFETDRELVVTPAQLIAACVRDPHKDQYSDYPAIATGAITGSFPAFEAEQPIDHALYIAVDDLLTLPGPKTVTLTLQSNRVAELQQAHTINAATGKAQIAWAYWDGYQWQSLSTSTQIPANALEIVLPPVETPQPIQVDSVMATWLRAKWTQALPPQAPLLPTLNHLSANVTITQAALGPDYCFFNTIPLDISSDFYPFGEQPKFNDTFYIGSQDAFAQGGQSVTISIALSPGLPKPESRSVTIVWEAWNGKTWEPILSFISENDTSPNALRDNGDIRLVLPNTMVEREVNGLTSYWIRARIVDGNYGDAATTQQKVKDNKPVVDSNSHPIYEFIPATFKPPSIQSLTLSYTYHAESQSVACRTQNDFLTINPLPTVQSVRTGAATSFETVQLIQLSSIDGFAVGDRIRIPASAAPDAANDYVIQELYPESQSIVVDRTLTVTPDAGTEIFRYFPIFHSTTDQQPSLYFGFDRPLSERAMTLYAQVEPPTAKQISLSAPSEASLPEPAVLRWDYYSSTGWKPLGAQDETQALSERGTIQFIGPGDMAARTDFDKPLSYWLRVRWIAGQFRVPPRLSQVHTNTIWASQASTLTNEILGSSNGNPDQQFQTTQFPVLMGPKLEVKPDQLEESWVRWQEVPDFYGSGPSDRHYTLDHLTGEVRFGNGQRGQVPPPGLNNIRLAHYRAGGGKQGNRPANTITQLKTTVPYIDRVTNLEAAGGGADQESLAQVQERGPKQLRHRGRAVTAQDFEDLAFEASPAVARAKAITPQFDPLGAQSGVDLWLEPGAAPSQTHLQAQSGQVSLLIVPHSQQWQPVPSLSVIDQVEAYIRGRCSPTLQLQVGGPQWVEVAVMAEIIPQSLDASDAVRARVVEQLNRFLHPLTGGKDAQGWDFGRAPHPSDFYALIESVPGVVRVRSLQIQSDQGSLPQPAQFPEEEPYLIFPGPHQIRLVSATDDFDGRESQPLSPSPPDALGGDDQSSDASDEEVYLI